MFCVLKVFRKCRLTIIGRSAGEDLAGTFEGCVTASWKALGGHPTRHFEGVFWRSSRGPSQGHLQDRFGSRPETFRDGNRVKIPTLRIELRGVESGAEGDPKSHHFRNFIVLKVFFEL